jgi:hypothetical protein
MKSNYNFLILGSLAIAIFNTQLMAEFKPANAEECLKATVRITTTTLNDEKSYGSGFFLTEGESTYIYTNSHVIDEAKKIEIIDNNGEIVRGIEWIEAFEEPFGKNEGPSSGDGVRFKLSKKRQESFSLNENWDELTKSRKIIVFGDNDGAFDGKQQIEILRGPILDNSNGILSYDCKSRQGSSGGAVVDEETLKVIGLNTWVEMGLSKDPYKRMLGIRDEQGNGIGVLLNGAKWKKFSVKQYMSQVKAISDMRKNLELMILLTHLTPTAHGLYSNPDDNFVAGMKIRDAIDRHKSNPSMKSLFALDEKISVNRNSNIKLSNHDTYKIYLSAIDSIMNKRKSIEPLLKAATLSYFYKNKLDSDFLRKGDNYYAIGIMSCREWFQSKISAGGTIPLGAWETLPPLGQKLAKEIEQKLLE